MILNPEQEYTQSQLEAMANEQRQQAEQAQTALREIERELQKKEQSNDFVLSGLIAELFDFMADGPEVDRERIQKQARKIAQRAAGKSTFYEKHPLTDLFFSEVQRPPGIHLPKRWDLPFVELHRGHYSVLGAYSGVGKTTTGLNIVQDVITEQKGKVLVFSVEMPAGQLLARLLAIHQKATEGQSYAINDIKKQAGEKWVKELLYFYEPYLEIVDAGGWTAKDILSYLEQYRLRGNEPQEPDLILIDYLQLLKPEQGTESLPRREQIIFQVDLLSQAIKDYNTALLCLAQTNRASNDGEWSGAAPSASGFQESAIIEQSASLALTLGRPYTVDDGQHKLEPVMEIRVAKNRFERSGNTYCSFDPKTGTILENNPTYTPPRKRKQSNGGNNK